jgi:hypothetical protein
MWVGPTVFTMEALAWLWNVNDQFTQREMPFSCGICHEKSSEIGGLSWIIWIINPSLSQIIFPISAIYRTGLWSWIWHLWLMCLGTQRNLLGHGDSPQKTGIGNCMKLLGIWGNIKPGNQWENPSGLDAEDLYPAETSRNKQLMQMCPVD